MVYSPFRSLGRFVLAACAVSLGAAVAGAQTPSTPAPMMGPNPSRVDIFTGFSYFGAHGRLNPGYIPYSSINEGAIGSGAVYFNKYVGGEVVAAAHPDGKNDGLYDFSAGPIFRAPMQNFTLFAHGLVGGARLGGPNSEGPVVYHEPYMWGATVAAGGGLDYALPFFNNHFGIRLFEADYRYTHVDYGYYAGVPTGGVLGGRANLSGIELSTGILTHFGSIVPPPPVTLSCVASPTSGFPGDPITVTGTAMNLNPKKTATYTWTSDGGVVSGTTATATVDTKSTAPGAYTVKGHVSEGTKPGMMADCSAPFTVMPFAPPTISCSANPSSVSPGDSATITAMGMSPQNRPLSYSYNATAGSISGMSSTATLSTSGAAPGTITVTCNVVDDKGQMATSMTSVTVLAPPQPPQQPKPVTSNLCSISFERDKARPTRVDNEAKACLDDVALNLQRSSDAKLALVGSEDAREMNMKGKRHRKYAAERAVNTKAYLVERGIDGSRIMTYTGTQEGQTVTTTLIPSGATMDMSGDTAVDEAATKAVPRTAAKRTRKRK